MSATFGLHLCWRIAILLWSVALLGVLGRVAVSPLTSQSVVPIYLGAADRWTHGDDLYAPYHFRAQPDVYRYPPGFAACFVPFTWLPPRVAALVWRVVSALVFLTGLWAWTRHGLHLSTGQRGTVFALAAPLVLPSLNNGQANLILIGLLLHGATAVIRGRGGRAGVCLAAAVAVKVYPVAVGLLLTMAFPRRVLPGFLLALVGFAVLPFALDPQTAADQYRRFAEAERAEDRRHGGYQDPPRDLYWVLRTYFVAPSDGIYTGVVIAAAIGMAAGVASNRGGDPRRVAVLAFDLGCVWMTVFGPATEPATYTLLAPTAATAVVRAWSSPARGQLAAALLGYLLLLAPVVRDFFPNGRAFHNLGPQPLGGLLLLGVVSMAAGRPGNCTTAHRIGDRFQPTWLAAVRRRAAPSPSSMPPSSANVAGSGTAVGAADTAIRKINHSL